MKRVVIIGAGQIGSRHLQSLALLTQEIEIYLVDPSEVSLGVANERYNKAKQLPSLNHKLKLFHSVDQLPAAIDIAIIATNSAVRARVIKELVTTKKVKNLILEKILFQTISDFEPIKQLLAEHAIPAWVNCWMRAMIFYQELKTRLLPDERIKISVEGPQWGLGCNSIHFIDLFAFFTDDLDISFDKIEIDELIFESKRDGFKEFTGSIIVNNSKGDTLDLNCLKAGTQETMIRIENQNSWHEIEGFNDIKYKYFDGIQEKKSELSIPHISQITNKIIEQILSSGNCDLTRYEDSMKLHIPFIKTILNHLELVYKKEIQVCPIT